MNRVFRNRYGNHNNEWRKCHEFHQVESVGRPSPAVFGSVQGELNVCGGGFYRPVMGDCVEHTTVEIASRERMSCG